MAQQTFAWVAGLLDQASYSEHTGRALYIMLAELGQLCGWSAFDAGEHGLAQRYYIAGLRAAHTADDRPFDAISSPTWRTRPSTRDNRQRR